MAESSPDEILNRIKQALGEKMCELYYSELGCMVYQTGHEHLLPQAIWLANKARNKHHKEKIVSEINKLVNKGLDEKPLRKIIWGTRSKKNKSGLLLSKMPDFTMVTNQGQIFQVEAKFRSNGKLTTGEMHEILMRPSRPDIFILMPHDPYIRILTPTWKPQEKKEKSFNGKIMFGEDWPPKGSEIEQMDEMVEKMVKDDPDFFKNRHEENELKSELIQHSVKFVQENIMEDPDFHFLRKGNHPPSWALIQNEEEMNRDKTTSENIKQHYRLYWDILEKTKKKFSKDRNLLNKIADKYPHWWDYEELNLKMDYIKDITGLKNDALVFRHKVYLKYAKTLKSYFQTVKTDK